MLSLLINELLWTEKCDVTAQAQIAYDETALLIHLSAVEKDIRSEESDILGMPCKDSCLKFFFSPVAGDSRYFNIEFNPNCCMFLGFGSGKHDLVRLLPQQSVAELFCPKARRTADGWELFYREPFSFVRCFFPDFEPESGKAFCSNCYKCGDLTAVPHYLA